MTDDRAPDQIPGQAPDQDPDQAPGQSQAPDQADELLLFCVSHADDEPERALVPYIAATTAAISGQRAIVVCTIEGVWTGVPDRADGIEVDGMPTLRDLQTQLVAAGGEIWLCSACTTVRGITGDQPLVAGAGIVGAARIVEALTQGRAITLA